MNFTGLLIKLYSVPRFASMDGISYSKVGEVEPTCVEAAGIIEEFQRICDFKDQTAQSLQDALVGEYHLKMSNRTLLAKCAKLEEENEKLKATVEDQTHTVNIYLMECTQLRREMDVLKQQIRTYPNRK